MLIFELLRLGASISLLICTALCAAAVGQNRTRRRVVAYKKMLFERVLHY